MRSKSKQDADPPPHGAMWVPEFAIYYGCDPATVWRYAERSPDLAIRALRSGRDLLLILDPAGLLARMSEPRVRFDPRAPAYAEARCRQSPADTPPPPPRGAARGGSADGAAV